MENNTIVKEINGITHYINPKFEKIMDGVEVREETEIINSQFTPPSDEETQQYEISIRIMNAKKYLLETDWYITRQSEIGTPIPEDILLKRSQARIDANE